MKAAVYRRYGGADVVSCADVPTPVPRDNEVLVRVRAATVGVVDSLARQGAPFYARAHFGLRRPRFPVLGSDFAGEVAAVGRSVSGFGAGEAVFGTCAPRFGAHAETAASLPILLQMGWTGVFGGRKAVVTFTGLRPAGEKRRDLMFIRELAEASALAGVVDADYPLARIGDAYARVDAGHKKGNVVVTMTGAP